MPEKRETEAEVWQTAIEHIADLPGVSADQRNAGDLVKSSALVSIVPQHKALERIGMPAAVYDADGDLTVGPDNFPRRVIGTPRGSTWTAIRPGGELLIFHPVELDGQKRTLCLGLNAGLLHQLIPDSSPLTQAEFAVLAGVMNGQSVRYIAEEDGVSYNTRRRQIEAAIEKLNVHSQVEAVRLTFVSLIDRLLAALNESVAEKSGIDTLAQLYGDQVRFHWIHLSGNPPLRVAEYGDPAGQPVLLFHPMPYPCGTIPSSIPKVRRAGFRVIAPLRPGYFDSPVWRTRQSAETALAAWSRQCNDLLSFLNLQEVHVACIHSSTAWATDFIRRFPSRALSGIFMAAPQPKSLANAKSISASFFYAAANVVDRAPWLGTPLVRLNATKVRNYASCVRAYRKQFRNSAMDLAAIEALTVEHEVYQIPPLTLRECTSGIVADLRVMLQPWETYLAGMDVPLHFVHGDDDQATPLHFIEKLLSPLPHAKLHVLKDRGQLFFLPDFAEALTAATRS